MFKMKCEHCKQTFDVQESWWSSEGPHKCPCCGEWLSRFPPVIMLFMFLIFGGMGLLIADVFRMVLTK